MMKWVALKNELDFLKELRKTSNIKIMIFIEKKMMSPSLKFSKGNSYFTSKFS